jgi:hypothetical protein
MTLKTLAGEGGDRGNGGLFVLFPGPAVYHLYPNGLAQLHFIGGRDRGQYASRKHGSQQNKHGHGHTTHVTVSAVLGLHRHQVGSPRSLWKPRFAQVLQQLSDRQGSVKNLHVLQTGQLFAIGLPPTVKQIQHVETRAADRTPARTLLYKRRQVAGRGAGHWADRLDHRDAQTPQAHIKRQDRQRRVRTRDCQQAVVALGHARAFEAMA